MSDVFGSRAMEMLQQVGTRSPEAAGTRGTNPALQYIQSQAPAEQRATLDRCVQDKGWPEASAAQPDRVELSDEARKSL